MYFLFENEKINIFGLMHFIIFMTVNVFKTFETIINHNLSLLHNILSVLESSVKYFLNSALHFREGGQGGGSCWWPPASW